jgi:hypothetical protein
MLEHLICTCLRKEPALDKYAVPDLIVSEVREMRALEGAADADSGIS